MTTPMTPPGPDVAPTPTDDDRPAPTGGPPRGVRAIVALVATLGVSAVLTGWAATQVTGPVDIELLAAGALVGVLTTASLLHVDIRRNGDVSTLDLFEAAAAPAIFCFPGLWAVGLVALGTALAEAILRIHPLKATFNVAQAAAAAGAGSLVFTLLVPDHELAPEHLLALLAAVLAVSAVNHLAVSAVFLIIEGRGARHQLSLYPELSVGWVVGTSTTLVLGTLFAVSALWAPATIPLFVAPLAFLHWASRAYAENQADLERLRGLQRATHVLAARVDPKDALVEFLTVVREAFTAELVELAVVGGDEQLVHRAGASSTVALVPADDGTGALARAVSARPAPERVVSDLAGSRLPRLLAREGWRECLAAPVEVTGRAGALCVYNPGGLSGSEEANLAVLSALAGEAGSALERSRLVDAALEEHRRAEEERQRSEARFEALVRNSSEVIVVVGPDGVVRDRLPTGATSPLPTDLAGTPVVDLVHPDDAGRVREVLGALVGEPGGVVQLGCRLAADDGAWRHVDVTATNLLGDPDVAGLVLTCRDTTDREWAAALLNGQTEILEAVAADTPLADVLTEVVRVLEAQAPGARCTFVMEGPSGVPERVAGAPLPSAVVAHVLASLGPGAGTDVVTVGDAAQELPWRATLAGELGDVRALLATPLRHADGSPPRGAVVLHFDQPRRASPRDRRLLELASRTASLADERLRSKHRLVHQATHDALTGLPNRLVFLDRAAEALARLRGSDLGLAVIFLDLDRFKVVNESLGHDAGDRLLQLLAARLRDAMRAVDTVARFGGDEFTVLCDGVRDEQEVARLAARIEAVVALPAQLGEHEISVTASLGIAHTTDPGIDPGTLVDNADTAMYRAKADGGNRNHVFHPTLRNRARHDLATHNALRLAVERGDFDVLYQPIVALDGGEVVGAEALVRWRHPERGIVAPHDFVPLAEETGLIVPIGQQVLREACRQSRAWSVADRPFTTCINLSARQFSDPRLAETVAEALAATGADPASITLEITESVLMETAETVRVNLDELRDLGIRLTIDDFGTGYSSLTYLKRFPVSSLKIDRSFVAGLGTDPNDSAIVSAVVGLAHSLGMAAVAEGVEHPTQLRLLRAMGCDTAQGHLFSEAVRGDDVCLDRLDL